MNGTQLDEMLSGVMDIKLLSEKDKQLFCQRVKPFILSFTTHARQQDEEDIKEFRQRVDNEIFDEKTVELARYFIDKLYDSLKRSLNEKVTSYENIVKKQIKIYKRNEKILRFIHRTLQIIIILGATSLPFILNIAELPRAVPTAISILVALAAALITYYKFRDHTLFFQQAAEKMQQEYSLYQSSRKHYSNLTEGAALDLFMDKIDELRHEQNELSLELEKLAGDQDKKIDELARVYKK